LRALPFGLAFPTLSDRFRSDFLGAFQVLAFAFSFPAFPTLSDRFPIRFPRRFPGFRFRDSLSSDSDFIRSFGPDLPASISESSGVASRKSMFSGSRQTLTDATGHVQL
ncbi:hypothetical protein ACWGDT_41615, partial [Streptomyces avermitilis]